MKEKLIVLGLSGVLLSAGIVGAQGNGSGGPAATSQEPEAQASESQASENQVAEVAQPLDAQRSAMLTRMLLGRPLDMGSTLTVTFYDGDPEAGGSELSSLEFVYGEDSEAAFAQELESAAAEASYVTVTTSPQTMTLNLEDATFTRLRPDRGGGFARHPFGAEEHEPGGRFDDPRRGPFGAPRN